MDSVEKYGDFDSHGMPPLPLKYSTTNKDEATPYEELKIFPWGWVGWD